MSQYQIMAVRQRKWMFYLLALFMLGAAFTAFQQVFLGLALGGAASLYNLWLLQKKVQDLGDAVVKQQKPKGLGTTARFATAALVILIVIKFPDFFNIVAVIIGLITAYIVMALDFIVFSIAKPIKEEGDSNDS